MTVFFLAGDLITLGICFELQSFALLGLLLQPQRALSSVTQIKANASAALYLLGYSLLSGAFYAYASWSVYALYGTLYIDSISQVNLSPSICN